MALRLVLIDALVSFQLFPHKMSNPLGFHRFVRFYTKSTHCSVVSEPIFHSRI